MSRDPREIISQSRMTILHVLIVLITFRLNSLDGFDILSISFASPGIAKEWHIAQAALGGEVPCCPLSWSAFCWK
jgi:hypothetical protein